MTLRPWQPVFNGAPWTLKAGCWGLALGLLLAATPLRAQHPAASDPWAAAVADLRHEDVAAAARAATVLIEYGAADFPPRIHHQALLEGAKRLLGVADLDIRLTGARLAAALASIRGDPWFSLDAEAASEEVPEGFRESAHAITRAAGSLREALVDIRDRDEAALRRQAAIALAWWGQASAAGELRECAAREQPPQPGTLRALAALEDPADASLWQRLLAMRLLPAWPNTTAGPVDSGDSALIAARVLADNDPWGLETLHDLIARDQTPPTALANALALLAGVAAPLPAGVLARALKSESPEVRLRAAILATNLARERALVGEEAFDGVLPVLLARISKTEVSAEEIAALSELASAPSLSAFSVLWNRRPRLSPRSPESAALAQAIREGLGRMIDRFHGEHLDLLWKLCLPSSRPALLAELLDHPFAWENARPLFVEGGAQSEMRPLALEAFRRFGHPEDFALLAPWWTPETPDIALIEALGFLRNGQARPLLYQVLSGRGSVAVKMSALRSLARMGAMARPEQRAAVFASLRTDWEEARGKALSDPALQDAPDSAQLSALSDAMDRAVWDRRRPPPPWIDERRRLLVDAAVQTGRALLVLEAEAAAILGIPAENGALRGRLLAHVLAHPETAGMLPSVLAAKLPRVAELFQHGVDGERVAFLRLAAALGVAEEAAIESAGALATPQTALRQAALAALARLDAPRFETLALSWLKSGDARVREDAWTVLLALPQAPVAALLKDPLSMQDPQGAERLLALAARSRGDSAEAELWRGGLPGWLGHESTALRVAAARLLETREDLLPTPEIFLERLMHEREFAVQAPLMRLAPHYRGAEVARALWGLFVASSAESEDPQRELRRAQAALALWKAGYGGVLAHESLVRENTRDAFERLAAMFVDDQGRPDARKIRLQLFAEQADIRAAALSQLRFLRGASARDARIALPSRATWTTAQAMAEHLAQEAEGWESVPCWQSLAALSLDAARAHFLASWTIERAAELPAALAAELLDLWRDLEDPRAVALALRFLGGESATARAAAAATLTDRRLDPVAALRRLGVNPLVLAPALQRTAGSLEGTEIASPAAQWLASDDPEAIALGATLLSRTRAVDAVPLCLRLALDPRPLDARIIVQGPGTATVGHTAVDALPAMSGQNFGRDLGAWRRWWQNTRP